MVFVCSLKIHHFSPLDNMMEDMDVDLDKEFLQDLKDLKILITDKDLLDQHKRCVWASDLDREKSDTGLTRAVVNVLMLHAYSLCLSHMNNETSHPLSLVCTALRGKTNVFNEMEANFKVRGFILLWNYILFLRDSWFQNISCCRIFQGAL